MPVITACGTAVPGACEAALAQAEQWIAALPSKLDMVYQQVATKAPNARVAVVGYPRLFDRRDCSPQVDFTRPEMRSFNAFGDRLDAILRDRAHAAGFRYIDVRDEFAGHAICTP